MSRIGNNPIVVPEGVTVDIQPGVITVKGKLGELTQTYSDVSIAHEDGQLLVSRPSDSKPHRAKHGLYRALVANMVTGVSVGFTKELELVGGGIGSSRESRRFWFDHGFLLFLFFFAFAAGRAWLGKTA